MSTREHVRAPGWIEFASLMMILAGLFNVFEGIIVLFNDDQSFIADDQLVVLDLTGFGWTLVVSGLVIGAAGVGLMWAKTWSRILAIIIVSLHAVTQIAWFSAYPWWSALMLALDVAVLGALTAGWSTVRDQLGYQGTAMPGALR